ncbi:MAG: PorT family protein [Bacteroidales bacterium]|jgi:hypothetical protein|nr:PorT family protein [Bacteroidales bacterium]
MKKPFLLFISTALSICACAQNSPFRVGATAGMELSNWHTKNIEDFNYEDFKLKAGLKLGAIGEYAFNQYVALSPELVFTQRGYRVSDRRTTFGTSYDYTRTATVNYLQLPLNLVFNIPINADCKFIALAGGYGAFAFSGTLRKKAVAYDYVGGEQTSKQKEEITIGSSAENDLRAWDFGLNVGAGIEYLNAFAKLQYNFGLSNLAPKSENNATITNGNIGISVGYLFQF